MENKLSKRLDRRSKFPLFIQLSNAFRRDILDGVYAFGDALPAPEELERELELPVETIKKTFDILLQEKLVYFDEPVYRSKFKSVPTVIFEEVSNFRYIIESRGMLYHVVDQPLFIETRQDGDWIVLNRSYFGDHQCLIRTVAHFKKKAFVNMVNKSIDDTRNFAAIFRDHGITRFKSVKIIDHVRLPEEFALEMNQPKNIVCSKTRYEVRENDQLILVSDSYIIGFGFRFNFMTQLSKK